MGAVPQNLDGINIQDPTLEDQKATARQKDRDIPFLGNLNPRSPKSETIGLLLGGSPARV